ncbi:MAG TPA: DMT family transporter [Kofleriaceae bacterium]|nr:DMT family transporter [Kofleriaceae bacterium]
MTGSSVPAPRHASTGIVLAIAGSITFSGKAIIVKVAYRYGVDAVTVIMYRMLVAVVPFLVIAWWAGRGKPALGWRDRASVVGLGVTGYYLSSFLDFVGLQYVSASLERLIIYLTPTLVLALGVLWFGQRVVRGQLVAIAVGYAGVLAVFGHEVSFAGAHVVLGAVLVFASTVSYALYLSYSGTLVARLGSLRIVGWASTVACVLCLLQFAILRPLSAAAVPAPVIWLSVLNGTLCTVIPVLLVMMAIERVGATITSQAGMIGPISTITMSVLILGEPVSGWLAVGTVLVVGSIWLLARRAQPGLPAPIAPDASQVG